MAIGMRTNGEIASLFGRFVRLIHEGRAGLPLRVVAEHRCAAALGDGMQHLPAVELERLSDGQILFAYRHEVVPIGVPKWLR